MNRLRPVMSAIQIDGSLGEGGGQVMRIALALSALYGIPVKIDNIRKNRSRPGLAAQHLAGVRLVADLCKAELKGGHIGSTSVEFYPKELSAGESKHVVDIQTAGCIPLILQIALPCLLFTQTTEELQLSLKGGTNVPLGPPIEYYTEVFRPLLKKFGGDFSFDVRRRGYYPVGKGLVNIWVRPVDKLNAVEMMTLGSPVVVEGWSYVAGTVALDEAYRMENDAKETLNEGLKEHRIPLPRIEITSYKEHKDAAIGNASGINLVCRTSTDCILGGSGIYSRDSTIPRGIEAAKKLLDPLINESCVDEHAQDQLIILMALAEGTSRINIGRQELTMHTQTAIKVAEMMLADRGVKFRLYKKDGTDSQILECVGCGLVNRRTG